MNTKFKYDTMATFFLLICLGCLSAINNFVSYLGQVFLITGVILVIFNSLKNATIQNYQLKIFGSFLPYVLVINYNLLINFSYKGIYHIFLLILCIVTVICSACYKFSIRTFKILSIIASVVIILLIPFNLMNLLILKKVDGIIHSNFIGATTLFMSFFVMFSRKWSNKKVSTLILIIAFLSIVASRSRASLLSILGFAITFIFWKVSASHRFFKLLYILLIFTIIFVITYVYPYFSIISPELYEQLNTLSNELTGKNIFSGRNFLWIQVFFLVQKKLILGYGPGALLSNFIDAGYSTHNMYLQILLQNGILGLLAFIFVFLSIWMKDNFNNKIIAGFLIAVLFQQIMEVSLIQNQLFLGLVQWFIIGLGLNVYIATLKKTYPVGVKSSNLMVENECIPS